MRYALIFLSVVVGLLLGVADCAAQNPTDLPAGEKLISFEGWLGGARWSQDGRTIVTFMFRKPKDDKDKTHVNFKTTELWDAKTGKRKDSLGELENRGYPWFFLSADGARLVMSQTFYLNTGEMEVWDTKRVTVDHRINVERRPRPVECVAVSPAGDRIAEIYWDVAGKPENGGVNLYDAATGKKVQTLPFVKCLPWSAVFTPDGQSVLTKDSNDVIRVWDIKSGKVVRETPTAPDSGRQLILSPDGTKLVSSEYKKKTLLFWSVPELKALPAIAFPLRNVAQIKFSPSGKRLLVSSNAELRNGEYIAGAAVWDLEKNKLLHHWNTPGEKAGFCGEDHIGIGERYAIMRYPIGNVAKKAGQ